ncbi:MAG: hypothetical protein QM743_07200 [Chitinophagaceae bacterium]
MTLEEIQVELLKVSPFKQYNTRPQPGWDKKAFFLFRSSTFEDLSRQIQEAGEEETFGEYVQDRWRGYLFKKAILEMMLRFKYVTPDPNRPRIADIWVGKIPFDVTVAPFPAACPFDYDQVKADPINLIRFLYHESLHGPKFMATNRLFVIVYRKDGRHWMMDRNLERVEQSVSRYFTKFKRSRLKVFTSRDGQVAFSDIVWVEV